MDVFAISPASSRPLWFLTIICVLLAVVLIALVYTGYSSRNSRVVIERDRMRLIGDFRGREVPFTLLNVSDARILDLAGNPEYAPKRRRLGTGLPGYASGWFRLRNGEKALVDLTKRRDVVYVPTSDGYAILLSLEEPGRFIETLPRSNPEAGQQSLTMQINTFSLKHRSRGDAHIFRTGRVDTQMTRLQSSV